MVVEKKDGKKIRERGEVDSRRGEKVRDKW